MRRALFLPLFVLLFSTMPLLASEVGTPSCGEITDLTDPTLMTSLLDANISPISDVRVEKSSDDSSVSSADFEVEGPDGEIKTIRVTCSGTCSGALCTQTGCKPKSDASGCTDPDCGHRLCISSCTQRVWELTDVIAP